jgi:hypothetical protein
MSLGHLLILSHLPYGTVVGLKGVTDTHNVYTAIPGTQ